MIIKILNFIKTIINFYIIAPFTAWWRYISTGVCLEDNERNQKVLDYLQKVAKNSEYEPSTPIEHFVEKQLFNSYNDAVENHADLIKIEYDGKIPSYDEVRSECATQIALEMLSYKWVKEETWDDE